MALTQHTITIAPALPARVGRAAWESGLVAPSLIGVVPVLPAGGNAANSVGIAVRARLDGSVVTVEASAPSPLTTVDVLVTLDA